MTSYIFAQAAEYAGLPNGAVNILCGLGSDAGVALTSHKDVNQIVFTGSVETGIAIASAAAKNVVPCVLELGGKSAAIVHSDADLDAFETDLRWGIYFNAGQVCSAMSRVIVHESRHAELIARAEKVAKSLKVAPGITLRESGEGMGMMVSHAQKDRAISMIGRAVEQGARVVTGAHGANMQGACLAPTVLDRVTPEIEIASQEVFGPVLSVLKFTNDAEAIEIANGTDYGLVAGVFTKDLDRATRAARALLAGQVFVNEWYAGGVETPFGGYGKSGYGAKRGVRPFGTMSKPRILRLKHEDHMSVFDEDLFLKGLEQRKGTLGADYVAKSLDAADEFTRPFQEAMTAWCWGFGWGMM